MKCGHYVKWAPRRRKGSGKEYQKVVDIKSSVHFGDELLGQDYVVCDGNVRCTTLEAVDEPDWGSTHAELNVEYKCDTCGCTFYPELQDDLSNPVPSTRENPALVELVNRGIDTITPKEQGARRAEWRRWNELSIEDRVAEMKAKQKELAAAGKTS